MTYVALLRGINVGGNNKVAMPLLKQTFENMGFKDVITYINSGNVIFKSDDDYNIAEVIEKAIEQDFGVKVKTIVRDLNSILAINGELPTEWLNDVNQKTDVLFLWEPIDNPEVFEKVNYVPTIENLKYVPGALLWNIDRKNINKSGLLKIVGTPLYRQMTVRNVNTVRKIAELMSTH